MPNLTITGSGVLPSSTALIATGTAGAAITRGQPVYLDSTDGRLKLADADLSLAAAAVVGIALQDVATGQPLAYVYQDDAFTPGATLVRGTSYILSATAGAIAPDADAVAGWFKSNLFVATSTTQGRLRLNISGAVV